MEKILDFYKAKNIEGLIEASKTPRQVFTLALMSALVARALIFDFMNPLMIAFLANFIGTKHKIYIVGAAAGLGVITRLEGLLMLKGLAAIVLVVLIHMLLNLAQIKPSQKTVRIVAGFAALFSGLLFAFLFDGGWYFVMMAVAKCVLAVVMTALMKEGVQAISHLPRLKVVGTAQALGLMIILTAMLGGAADIYIGVFALKYVLLGLVVLYAAKHGGASYAAVCGVSLGAMLAFLGSLDYSLLGIFSVGGIVAGLFQAGGKKAIAPGFLFGAFLGALYMDVQIMSVAFIFSTVSAAVLFMVSPDNNNVSVRIADMAVDKTDQMKKLVEQRLLRVSASFKNMGTTLAPKDERRTGLSQRELSRIVEDTAAKACGQCPNHENCWGKNYVLMHHVSLRILEDLERGVEFPIDDYDGSCEYIGYFSGWISRQYDLYKLNLSWQNRMLETKQLMSRQMLGVSEIVEGLLYEVKQDVVIRGEFLQPIINEFAKIDVEVSDVIVLENAQGKYSVSFARGSCFLNVRCFKDAAKVVSGVVGRKMISVRRSCSKSVRANAKCTLSFVEEPKFRIRSAAAYAKKDGSSYSGDCHSVMEIRSAQAILALSDGMGSGEQARAESEAAMGLLRDFLEAGFSRELALRMINSVLVLKDGSEHFSTMDICAIDIHTGLAQFIKFGAASTFVKRGDYVSQIVSESLPMGILSEIDAGISRQNVKGGDIIVMITDGVCDSGAGEPGEVSWVAEALAEHEGKDPQDVADYLIGLAKERANGEVKDDMTILCARVYSKSA